MISDRFSAQLRQHLLDTADEGVADGQLASIVDRVAATSQRPTLVARLPWFSPRVGSAAVQLRWALVVLALIAATVAVAIVAGGSLPRSAGFEGTWTASDPVDASTWNLVVAAGETPAVRYLDDMAAGLVCGDDPGMPFVADGTGTVEGNRLRVTWTATNGCDLDSVPASTVYTYDNPADALVDEIPVTWTRSNAAMVLPTPRPRPEGTPTPASDCVEFGGPGSYTAPAGSMSLTVGVPGTQVEPWIGSRGTFQLLQAACADFQGSSRIEAAEVTRVDTTACTGATLAVDTYEEAVAAVSTASGIDVVAQTDASLGGYPGTRFDITIPMVANACTDQQIPLVEGVNPFDPGLDVGLYLIDVDGKTLALALFAPSTWSPGRTAKVDSIVDSLEIDTAAPAATSAPSEPPTADCIEFDAPSTYTAPEGSLSLTVDIPGTPSDPWIGSRREFNLLNAACDDWSGPGAIDGGEVLLVHNDACDGHAVNTVEDAVAAVSASTGLDVVARTDVTLGGHPGTQFDLFVHEDANACTAGLVDGVTLEPGVNVRLFLIDVDGKTLALALYGHQDWGRDVRAMADEILASLQIER